MTRGPRRAVRPGREQGPVFGASADELGPGAPEPSITGVTDDSDGAGASPSGVASNDERLRSEVPPHWEPSKRF